MKLRNILLAALLFASTASAQTVISEQMKWVSVTPTVDTSAYANKDNIGGLQTLSTASTPSTAICTNSATFKINSVVISDKSDNSVTYDIVFFKSNPSTSTITDQATFDPSDADLAKLLPVIEVASANHFTWNDNGASSLSSLSSGGFIASSGGALYFAITTTGAPTYTGASDLTITFGIICN